MKAIVYKSEDRGYANHGWLEARHSFSFANWYNPNQMNFGLLRVLNDDIIAPGAGFPTHPHENMEIITIPLSGTLEHKDSMGNKAQVKTGEVQIMSAGTGVTHSEYNASDKEVLKLFQIWIFPKKQNIQPRYGQLTIDRSIMNEWSTIISPDDADNTLALNQDVYMSLLEVDADKQITYKRRLDNSGIYIMVVEGTFILSDVELSYRDGIGILGKDDLDMLVRSGSRLLLIEMIWVE
jgi:hypothetical protein